MDEVEEELAMQKQKKSVWEDFDLSKISNAGFKLEYVAPKTHGESPIVEIELDHISSEIEF